LDDSDDFSVPKSPIFLGALVLVKFLAGSSRRAICPGFENRLSQLTPVTLNEWRLRLLNYVSISISGAEAVVMAAVIRRLDDGITQLRTWTDGD
jgi:hypothetical protein